MTRPSKLWDTKSRAALETLKGHSGYVNAVMFSPHARMLVSASSDGAVKLWDIRLGAMLQLMQVDAVVYTL